MDLRSFLASTQQHPKKILKVVISLSVVLLVIWLFLVSRMELGVTGNTSDAQTVERTDSLRTALNRDSQFQGEREENPPNIFMNAFTTFLVLGTILIIVLIFIKKGKGQSSNKQLKEIENYVLGQGAQIKVIALNEEVWVMGITSTQINLLHRYSKEEWKHQVDHQTEADKSFYHVFKNKL